MGCRRGQTGVDLVLVAVVVGLLGPAVVAVVDAAAAEVAAVAGGPGTEEI